MAAKPISRRQLLRLSGVGIGTMVLGGILRTITDPNEGARDKRWERIRRRGYMTVGVDPSLPPFATFDADGEPIGFEIDLAQAIGDEMGLDVWFTILSFDSIYDTLHTGYADIVLATLRRDPLRLDIARYTRPYFDGGQVLVAQTPLCNLSDDTPRRVGVEFASEGDLSLRDEPHITLERFFTATEALTALEDGLIDAALVDHVSVLLYRPQNRDAWHVCPQALIPDPFLIAVREPAWRLHRAVEAALDQLDKNGQIAALVERWFSPQR